MENLNQLQKCELFYKMHQGKKAFLLPNAWDAGSAVLMQHLEFPAIATTSAGIAFANGFSDNETMDRARMIAEVAAICERVKIPVSADLEAGYGNTSKEVAETIRQAISAGAAGANIEDSRVNRGKSLLDPEEAAERILASKETISNSNLPFVLNARVDTYLRLKELSPQDCFRETLRRAGAYIEAGADCIFIPGIPDRRVIAELAKEINAPLNVLGAYSGASFGSLEELQEAGAKRVTIGGSLSLYALSGVKQALEEMKLAGTFSYASSAMSNAAMNDIMRVPEILQ